MSDDQFKPVLLTLPSLTPALALEVRFIHHRFGSRLKDSRTDHTLRPHVPSIHRPDRREGGHHHVPNYLPCLTGAVDTRYRRRSRGA